MLEKSVLEKYDIQKMYKVYDMWPEMARESFESNLETIEYDKIHHIVFAGMGGSGAIGDMFASILSKSKIHVNVVKGYLLPNTTDSNTLVIAVSVSGNTLETLSVIKEAQKIGSKIIAFSSGGQIERFCKEAKIEHRIIPEHHSPRASFTAYLYAMLKVLYSPLNIQKRDIIESLNELEKLKERISYSNLNDSNPSLNLAEWITGMPMIYYPFGLQSAAIRFKNSLQENAKSHAAAEDIIEFCHNGIVAWERQSQHQPILLQGVDDYIKTKERWKILEKLFSENNIEYWKITSQSGSILTKIINLTYQLDMSSVYLAVKNQIDPTTVKSINYIKEKLNIN